MKKVLIIGGRAHSKVVIDTIKEMIKSGENLKIIGFLDNNIENNEIYDYPRLGL